MNKHDNQINPMEYNVSWQNTPPQKKVTGSMAMPSKSSYIFRKPSKEKGYRK